MSAESPQHAALDAAVRAYIAATVNEEDDGVTHPIVATWILGVEAQALKDGDTTWLHAKAATWDSAPSADAGLSAWLADEFSCSAFEGDDE